MPKPKRTRKPAVPEIPSETWRELYAMADAFGALQLWECMGDAELLGVDDPQTGEPMLGAVMGGLGELFGIAIHHGPAGLRWVLDLATSEDPVPDLDAFLNITVVKVEFVPRRELMPEEKLRVKEIGFVPSGGARAKWPTFQSQRPGYMPWHIDGDDVRLLLHALPRLTALGAAVRPLCESDDDFPSDGFAFWPRDRDPAEPLRLDEVEWRHVRMPEEQPPEPFTVDEQTSALLAKLPQQAATVIELDAFGSMMPVSEGGENGRPWSPKMALAAETSTGIIAGMEMSGSPRDLPEAIAGRAFVGGLKTLGVRPGAVHLKNRRTAQALGPLAAQLGIRLVLCRELPALDEVLAEMPPQFGFGLPM